MVFFEEGNEEDSSKNQIKMQLYLFFSLKGDTGENGVVRVVENQADYFRVFIYFPDKN